MCDPTTLAYAALAASAGQAVMGYVEGSRQASAQDAAIRQSWESTQQQFAVQRDEVNDQATSEMSERAREARIERARLQTIAAESGLGGLSNDRLESETFFTEGSDLAAIEGNRKRTQRQINANERGAYSDAQSKVNAVKRPSLIGAGLQIAGAGADFGTTMNKIKAGKASTGRTR